ncbi:MAG TPA: hypothetical protein VLX68_11985 [Chitinivibrionales bacterium]|nr:hypothetical protein [Chitinivibrionales bacterium]
MKRRVLPFAALLALWAALWLCRCSVNIASGTETGNPDITACAQAMAKEALAALHTKNLWQPSAYLDSAAAADTVQNVPLASAPAGLSKRSAALADTAPVNDSSLIIYDTVTFYDTVFNRDTSYIRDTIMVADTVSRPLPAAGDTAVVNVTVRKGSIVICDTAVIADTVLQKRAKVVVRVVRQSDGAQLLYAVTDTLWLAADSGGSSIKGNPAPVVPAPQWTLANVAYTSAANTAQVDYLFVSAVPVTDTVSLPAHDRNCIMSARPLFVSRSTAAGATTLSRVYFSEPDSTLGIVTFYPGVADTAESLTVAYKVDIGKNLSSAGDDRLLAISRSVVYRSLSPYRSISIRISPDPQTMTGVEPAVGLASITLTNANGASAAFYGVADTANGLTGVITRNGSRYQVSVGIDGKTSVVEIVR